MELKEAIEQIEEWLVEATGERRVALEDVLHLLETTEAPHKEPKLIYYSEAEYELVKGEMTKLSYASLDGVRFVQVTRPLKATEADYQELVPFFNRGAPLDGSSLVKVGIGKSWLERKAVFSTLVVEARP